MAVEMRAVGPEDSGELGRILHNAFAVLADRHNFPKDVPSVEIGAGMIAALIDEPGRHGVVALGDGKLLGSNFVDLRSPIAAIGPISVDPEAQNAGVGRGLMDTVMAETRRRNAAGIRLVQAAYHNRSLCLYTSLGFVTREPLSVLQGAALNARFAGYDVRPATVGDLAACNELCRRVHGFDRGKEMQGAIVQNSATVVEHLGRITGYATDIGFGGHAVAESNRDLQTLIGAAGAISGPGLLLPTRNHEVFSWCLDQKLRLVMQMTLMTIGLYNEPQGAYLPSIYY